MIIESRVEGRGSRQRCRGPVASAHYRLGDLLTVPELARELSVAEKTVRDWIYKRAIPYTKLRGRIYFSKELVEGLLARCAREPLPSARPVGSPEAGQPEKGGASCEKEDNNGS